MWRNIKRALTGATSSRKVAKRQPSRRMAVEHLEDRQLLAVVVPQQGNNVTYTSGGTDWVLLRANTLSTSTSVTDEMVAQKRDYLDSYLRENSSGRTYVDTFEAPPVFNLNLADNSNVGAIESAMRSAATALGINLSNKRIIYVYNGSRTDGAGNAFSGSYRLIEAIFTDPNRDGDGVFVHEGLHALGLGHPQNFEFGDDIYRPDYDLATSPHSQGFANSADPLGGFGRGYVSAYQRYYLGWLTPGNVQAVEADAAGVYRIYEHTSQTLPTSRTVAMQIGDAADQRGLLWLTYTPEPEKDRPQMEKGGIFVSVLDQGRRAQQYVLDTTPNSQQSYIPDTSTSNFDEALWDLSDAAMVLGDKVAIPFFNTEIEVIARGGTGDDQWMDVRIRPVDAVVTDKDAKSFSVDFGPDGSAFPAGSLFVTPSIAGDINWSVKDGSTITAKNTPFSGQGSILGDAIYSTQAARYDHELQNGLWRVTATLGDGTRSIDNTMIRAEGVVAASNIDPLTGSEQVTFEVEVLDGGLTLEFSDDDATNAYWSVTGLELELLEHRVLPSLEYAYDFGAEDSATETDPSKAHKLISPEIVGRGDIYWSSTVASGLADGTGSLGAVFSDNIRGESATTLSHKIENGYWRIYLTVGDARAIDNMSVTAEGETILGDIDTAAGEIRYVSRTGATVDSNYFEVLVTDGELNIEFNDTDGGSGAKWVVNSLQLSKVGISVDPSETYFAYDFGAPHSVVEPGFDRITARYTAGDVRFATNTSSLDSRTRYFYSSLMDTEDHLPETWDNVRNLASSNVFEHTVANGTWRVTLVLGETRDSFKMTNGQVSAEGEVIASNLSQPTGPNGRLQSVYVSRAGGSVTETSFDVEVTDGSLTLDLSRYVINSMRLERVDLPADANLGSLPSGETLAEDHWRSNLVFNKSSVYVNTTAEVEYVTPGKFRFDAAIDGGPVTPLLAKWNGGDDFTILAVGRTYEHYRIGVNTFRFSDNPLAVQLEPGESLIAGYMDSRPDGSDSGVAPIAYVEGGDSVWRTGGDYSGSLALGVAPTLGEMSENINRTYAYSIEIRTVTENSVNAPTVVDAAFDVPRSAATGTEVGTVTATDPNNLPLTYQIVGGNVGNAFSIDNNGVLRVANPSGFNTTSSYSLTVQATNGQFASTGGVEVAIIAPQQSTLLQAEDFDVAVGVSVDSNHQGFRGSGFVNPGFNSFMEWQGINGGTGGQGSVTFRYALGAAETRTLYLSVNGGAEQAVEFASTGAWSSWQTLSVDIPLVAGLNTLRVSAPKDGPNLDELEVLTPVEDPLPGDYDGNDVVDQADYTAWKESFGQTGVGLAADGNGDGKVNLADYTVWRDNLGASRVVAAASTSPQGIESPSEPFAPAAEVDASPAPTYYFFAFGQLQSEVESSDTAFELATADASETYDAALLLLTLDSSKRETFESIGPDYRATAVDRTAYELALEGDTEWSLADGDQHVGDLTSRLAGMDY